MFTEEDRTCIDEIKGVYRNIDQMEEPVPVHRAQALCYAWIWMEQQKLDEIDVQMTYVNLDTEGVRRFRETVSHDELEKWYQNLMDAYYRWISYQITWRKERNASMENLEFPFP